MTRYVLGFLFNHNHARVLLLKKARGPASVVGRLNGVGGKINDNEGPSEAMRREGIEECGVDASWAYYGQMTGRGWAVDCFWATIANEWAASTQDETEPVAWFDLSTPIVGAVDNVPLLLAAANLARTSFPEDVTRFRLTYV